jgi:hypothetical protein
VERDPGTERRVTEEAPVDQITAPVGRSRRLDVSCRDLSGRSKTKHGAAERRSLLALGIASLVLLAVLVWAVVLLVHAFPPRTVRMTTGPRGEADDRLGERYRAVLARKAVGLQLVPSAGMAENLARLATDR